MPFPRRLYQRPLFLGLFFFVILIIFAVLAAFFYPLIMKPMIASTSPARFIHYEKNESASLLVRKLSQEGLIQSPKLLLALLKLKGMSSHLKAGIYQIKPGESAYFFMRRIMAGDVYTYPYMIIEGATIADVVKQLEHTDLISKPDDWHLIQQHYSSAEGLLLSETYQVQAGSLQRDVLQRANRALWEYLNQAYQKRAPNLPYHTPYDLLIVASIVEKESAIDSERRLIAGVVINRLNHHMPLQMDPTVIYALGHNYHGKLTHQDLRLDSPYNTYRYRGLPPTPIAMVSRAAIDAVAHPARSDYYYFVARGDGTHQFSKDYQSQRQAIQHYIKGNK
jgi:UPF0755 protein